MPAVTYQRIPFNRGGMVQHRLLLGKRVIADAMATAGSIQDCHLERCFREYAATLTAEAQAARHAKTSA